MASLPSSAFGAFIEHESGPLKPLDKAVIHPIHAGSPSVVELDTLQWGHKLNGPHETEPAGHDVPITPGELEQSRPATPAQDNAVDALAAFSPYTTKNKWRLAGAGLVFLFVGMTDAVTGAVLPSIESQYNVSYSVVSLLFVAYALGFIASAPVISTIDAKLGRARLLMLACSCMSIGYTTLICAPPFPVVVLSFWVTGTGMALFLATSNAWIVNLMNGTVLLGFMHGLYGVGGIISPLIATAMISRGIRWSYFYLIPLVLALTGIGLMGWSWRGFEADSDYQLMTALERTASRRSMPNEPSKRQQLWTALKNRTTLLGALFIFFYQGGEVAISGWVISYLIQHRDGDPSKAGNVTAGFWGGITLGRFILTPLCHKVGERKAVLGLIVGAAVSQALVWAVPNFIANAVAESIVGFFLGPVYPLAVAVFSMRWPRKIQTSSLGLVTSMGSSGAAIVPFITGLMAQSLSTVVLHPIVLFSLAVMVVAWACLPKIVKRTE